MLTKNLNFDFSESICNSISEITSFVDNFQKELSKSIAITVPTIIEYTNTYNEILKNFDFSELYSRINNIITIMNCSLTKIQNIKIHDEFISNISPLYNVEIEDVLSKFTDFELEQLRCVEHTQAEELKNDIEATLSDENWQQNLMNIVKQWELKNPIIAKLLKIIIIPIIVGVLISVANNYTISTLSAVKENPSSDSNIIYNISGGSEVTIINQCPYYYQVSFDNGTEIIRGWVAKKNVKKISCPISDDYLLETTE